MKYTVETSSGFLSTVYPSIDMETYSEAGYLLLPNGKIAAGRACSKSKRGLPAVNAPAYAEHPSSRVLCLAYDLLDGIGPRLWIEGQPEPDDLKQYVLSGQKFSAWNDNFEYLMWHYVLHLKLGWVALARDQLMCTMTKAACYGLPLKLGASAKVLGTTQKIEDGERLIKLLSVPHNKTKKHPYHRYTPETHPDDFLRLYSYCIGDIITEREINERIPDLSPDEQVIYDINAKINMRGFAIDNETVEAAEYIAMAAEEKYGNELKEITGDPTISAGCTQRIKTWFENETGIALPNLQRPTVASMVKNENVPERARRVLRLRQLLGSSSIKKLKAFIRTKSSDNRLRCCYQMAGALQTQRWVGRGAQPQNFPSDGPQVTDCDGCNRPFWVELPDCPHCGAPSAHEDTDWSIEAAELAIEAIKTRNLNHVEALYGDPAKAISGSLRAMIVAGEGKQFICSDFSAIEAVCLAYAAGVQWRMEVFSSHGKIYETSASKITGVPFEEFMRYKAETGNHHPLRKKIGKVAELASGYQGWINAWKNFGAAKFMTDDEIKQNILKWRAESPEIVEFWGGQWRRDPYSRKFHPEYYGLEGCAILAILHPGKEFRHRCIVYYFHKSVLYCRLPSGRLLTYHEARVVPSFNPLGYPVLAIKYKGYSSKSGWHYKGTYGGSLTENVVQAMCRDRFAYSFHLLEDAGYPIVMHTHDEITCETPLGYGNIEEYERIMEINPDWCKTWPFRASGGWIGKRFRK